MFLKVDNLSGCCCLRDLRRCYNRGRKEIKNEKKDKEYL